MICREKGVLPGSEYFFFTPSEELRQHFYCVLNCGHFYCREGYSIRREGNTVPLFLYIMEGEFHLEYEGGCYTAIQGDIVLINGQKPHFYYSGKHCDFIYIHYSGHDSIQLTDYLIGQNQSPLFKVENHPLIRRLVHTAVEKLYCNEEVGDIELSCIIYNCLCRLKEYSGGSTLLSDTGSRTIADSILFIRRNVKEDLTLDILAGHASLSPYYFAHLFKKEIGVPPMEYIARYRINMAKTILKTTQQSVGEIADSLGYSSSSSFINAFTRRVGVSPLKFRNSLLS